MINWITHHIETAQDGTLVKVRIGEPSPEFWYRWKTSKAEFINNNYTVFFTLDKSNKKHWYVKHPIQVIRNPENLGRDIPDIQADKLLSYQPAHLNQLHRAFANGHGVVDASDTGTGKTPVACALAKAMKLIPAIVCPLAVIPQWVKWCKYIGINPLFIANYEEFKGKGNRYGYLDVRYYPAKLLNVFRVKHNISHEIYFRSWKECIDHLKKHYSPQINEMIAYYVSTKQKKFPRKECREVKDFYWNLPENVLLIFDEAHKCKGTYTQNAQMLIASKSHRTLMLSATLAQSPRDMRAIGYLLGLHQLYDFNKWTRKNSCFQNQWNGWECTDPIGAMQRISAQIFPIHGSRMRISEISDFPETQITAEPYQSDIREEYNKAYHGMLTRIESLQEQGAETVQIFTEIIRFRQASELMKVPLYVSMAQDAIENGLSVAIFVNYTETREAIQIALNTNCAVYGTQSPQEREYNIEAFQRGSQRIIVLMATAGGVGISLHDVYGNYQRMSIISPTYDSRVFKQVLGRLHRSGSKTKSLQRIIYLEGTIETSICESVNRKLDNISALNDGDLMETDLLKFNKKEKCNDNVTGN